MPRFANLHEIERLDPERDCQRILHLSFGYRIEELGPPRMVEGEDKRKVG